MKRARLTLLLLLPMLSTLGQAESMSWNQISWFEDAAGYAKALSAAESSGAPVLVYFYTDWCPYCRQLNTSLLGDPQVQAQLSEMLAVRVNAEAGPDERSLAGHYRVRGYPALFVYSSAQGGGFQAIRRTVGGESGMRLKTAEEFVATLRGAMR